MIKEIKLPDLGDGIESGDVLELLVESGDHITKDQGILEIETDKAAVEVPSTHAGRVVQVHIRSGQTVRVGQPLITLEVEELMDQSDRPNEAPEQSPAASQPRATESPTTTETAPRDVSESAEQSESAERAETTMRASHAEPLEKTAATSTPKTAEPVEPARTAAPATHAHPASTSSTTAPAGPAVRRFAREVGVDLATVHGSGPGGRIVREDILKAVRVSSKSDAVQGSRDRGTTAERDESSQRDDWGPVVIEPLSKIRKTIAAKMHQSWTTAPRVTNFDDADVTRLEKIRQSSKADYAEAGIKLTTMPFIIKAVAMALRQHPLINASLDSENDQLIYKEYVHIGIAVDTDRGLVVPVLRNADQMSISDAARELSRMATKVRSNDFSLDELRGGTFTISNLGSVGGAYSTPIINVPEVAILLIGRGRKMPVVTDDDEIAIRLIMPLSLSYDHRLVDGATASRFLNDVIEYLEAPSRLLLAP